MSASPLQKPGRKKRLPLPDPYPDYVPCPVCGEPEVEVWCYQATARCHQCGAVFAHPPERKCQDCQQSPEQPDQDQPFRNIG